MEYPDILGITMQILQRDSVLFINDYKGDTLIHVYNLKTGQIICKLIPQGQGPGELISPLYLSKSAENLLMYSMKTNCLYSLPFDSITLLKNKLLTKKFKTAFHTNRLYPLNDSVFVCSGFLDKKRYAMINCRGETVLEFGEYPEFCSSEKDFPDWARFMFHQSDFVRHPASDRFLSYSNHVLEIFDCDGNFNEPLLKKRILFGKYNYTYYEQNGQYVLEGDDVERGITDVGCDSNYIYIVYSINKKSEPSTVSYIKILDWEGNPVKQLNCQKRITRIAVDEKAEKAYLIIQNPDDNLMYWDMKK
jgi:hypothetical protein